MHIDISYTLCQIRYYVPKKAQAMELMGSGSGLSLDSGRSLAMQKERSVDDEWDIFSVSIELRESCEFFGRAYTLDEDLDEEVGPYRLIRQDDGSINLVADEGILETVRIFRYPPTEWVPELADAEARLVKDREGRNSIQYIIDSIIYVFNWMNRPKVLFLHLPLILRNVRKRLRQFDSHQADELLRPLLKIYFEIIMEIRETDETQDPRILPKTFETRGYGDKLLEVLDAMAKSPVFNPDIEWDETSRTKDSIDRMRAIFQYL